MHQGGLLGEVGMSAICSEGNVPNNILGRYRPLYRSAESMGAANILRSFLGLGDEFPVPMSLAHGVDMNHLAEAMDVHSLEPLHWSCNEVVYRRAQAVKTPVLMPHPWLMLSEMKGRQPGSGTLVIGPPPGVTNDSRLLESLAKIPSRPFDVLIKERGSLDTSISFWRNNGVSTKTAGHRDQGFYSRLYDIINSYETIVGCTLSSALFFGASIGKRIIVLKDYWYSAFETESYPRLARFDSEIAQDFVGYIIADDQNRAMSIAQAILGAEKLADRNVLRSSLERAVTDLTTPLHLERSFNRIERSIRIKLALLTGKEGFLTKNLRDISGRRKIDYVSLIKINEIDVWLNGPQEANLFLSEVPYRRGITEPGFSAE